MVKVFPLIVFETNGAMYTSGISYWSLKLTELLQFMPLFDNFTSYVPPMILGAFQLT